MINIPLIVERNNETDVLWGRIDYRDDLIVDFAPTFDELEEKMYKHITDLYKLGREEVTLEPFYDLTAFFKEKNFLNLSAVAERAGINRSVMAQYAAGIKHPSLKRAAEIQQVIHSIGNELQSVNLAVKSLPVSEEWVDDPWESTVLGKMPYAVPDVNNAIKILKYWKLKNMPGLAFMASQAPVFGRGKEKAVKKDTSGK